MVKDHSGSKGNNPLCHYIGYSFRLTASDILCAPPHRHHSTNHDLCYNSRGALAGTRNILMKPTTYRTMEKKGKGNVSFRDTHSLF